MTTCILCMKGDRYGIITAQILSVARQHPSVHESGAGLLRLAVGAEPLHREAGGRARHAAAAPHGTGRNADFGGGALPLSCRPGAQGAHGGAAGDRGDDGGEQRRREPLVPAFLRRLHPAHAPQRIPRALPADSHQAEPEQLCLPRPAGRGGKDGPLPLLEYGHVRQPRLELPLVGGALRRRAEGSSAGRAREHRAQRAGVGAAHHDEALLQPAHGRGPVLRAGVESSGGRVRGRRRQYACEPRGRAPRREPAAAHPQHRPPRHRLHPHLLPDLPPRRWHRLECEPPPEPRRAALPTRWETTPGANERGGDYPEFFCYTPKSGREISAFAAAFLYSFFSLTRTADRRPAPSAQGRAYPAGRDPSSRRRRNPTTHFPPSLPYR